MFEETFVYVFKLALHCGVHAMLLAWIIARVVLPITDYLGIYWLDGQW